jgi:hypothetical protein
MPNLCETRIRVTGPAQFLDAFVEHCLPGGALDFDKIIPSPPVIEETQARDWRIAHWGTSYIEGFQLVERTDTALEATFATPWSTADKVFHEMARRHPHVAIRVAVAEPGNEYSYLFTAAEGAVREEEPGLTEEFMEEVQGAPTEVDDFYLRPATLRSRALLHFRHWRDETRLRRALAGYPVYEPPHQGIEMLMDEREARENFEHFMSSRAERIEHLRGFLAPFGVPLAFSDETKTALDAWIARYAGFLYVRESGSSFLTRNPPWRGSRAGLNVVFDLAILLGEFAIHESDNLQWEMYTDVPTGLRKQSESYQRPVIAGFPDRERWRSYVMDEVYSICHALQERCYLWAKPHFHFGSGTLLYTQFASRKLRYLHCMARGDADGANRALNDA